MKPDSLREKPKQTGRFVTTGLAVLVAIAIFVMSSLPGSFYPPHPEYLNIMVHLAAYCLLAALLTFSFNSPARKLWIAGLLAIILASVYGVSDEVHQYFVPGRNTDVFDWLTDTAGAIIGAAVCLWLISARTVRKSRERDRSI
ncbi:MAG: VanZ family protein [Coriobacteriia bacterium]|nr:VanZ family protein [Coriobacteriia bacterium]